MEVKSSTATIPGVTNGNYKSITELTVYYGHSIALTLHCPENADLAKHDRGAYGLPFWFSTELDDFFETMNFDFRGEPSVLFGKNDDSGFWITSPDEATHMLILVECAPYYCNNYSGRLKTQVSTLHDVISFTRKKCLLTRAFEYEVEYRIINCYILPAGWFNCEEPDAQKRAQFYRERAKIWGSRIAQKNNEAIRRDELFAQRCKESREQREKYKPALEQVARGLETLLKSSKDQFNFTFNYKVIFNDDYFYLCEYGYISQSGETMFYCQEDLDKLRVYLQEKQRLFRDKVEQRERQERCKRDFHAYDETVKQLGGHISTAYGDAVISGIDSDCKLPDVWHGGTYPLTESGLESFRNDLANREKRRNEAERLAKEEKQYKQLVEHIAESICRHSEEEVIWGALEAIFNAGRYTEEEMRTINSAILRAANTKKKARQQRYLLSNKESQRTKAIIEILRTHGVDLGTIRKNGELPFDTRRMAFFLADDK